MAHLLEQAGAKVFSEATENVRACPAPCRLCTYNTAARRERRVVDLLEDAGTTRSTESEGLGGSRFLMLGEKPRTPWPDRITCMTRRASTWATGRKEKAGVGES